MSLGIYVHVPFCTTRCRYCDFYRVGFRRDRLEVFLEALHREIEGWEALHGEEVPTIFLGGGTPSLLEPEEVGRVLDRLDERFHLTTDCEITAEANPSDLSRERLDGFRAAGVNRLSIGVQSFSDRELKLIGRRHDAARAAQVVRRARAAGFERLSMDLILGLPGQTEAGWRDTIRRAVDLEPEHLSLYMLEIHEDTPIDGLRRTRPGLFPSDDTTSRRYLEAVAALADAGYRGYEISNFSRPDEESRHNLRYWCCQPVLGLGPAAHSLLDGRRFSHPRDLNAWCEDPMLVQEEPCDLKLERLFLGLRLRDGLPWQWVEETLGLEAAALSAWGDSVRPWLDADAERLRLNPQGMLLSNALIADLLELAPWPDCEGHSHRRLTPEAAGLRAGRGTQGRGATP